MNGVGSCKSLSWLQRMADLCKVIKKCNLLLPFHDILPIPLINILMMMSTVIVNYFL